MKSWRIARRIVFSLVKLMMLIIFVGILAVIAIPLYTGYVERARITEATSIMGAIITSQKVEKRRAGKYYSASTIAGFKSRRIPLNEPKFFTYKTIATPDGGFAVTATPTDAFGAGGGPITYTYDPAEGGRWGSDEVIILDDILLLQT